MVAVSQCPVHPPPIASRERLAEIIAECKARPRRVVIPAGKPGPDGQARQYPIDDDAFGLIWEPRVYVPESPPKPKTLTVEQRVERLERIVAKLRRVSA